MLKRIRRRVLPPLTVLFIVASAAADAAPVKAQGSLPRPSIIYKVQGENERLEMTVNTSRRLTLDKKIPEAQVNNPEILELTPLSPNTIQVSAKSPGVTQINLWDEDQKVYTIDVVVYADARELAMLLKSQFPNSSLKVVPVASGVLISGYVDQPGHVSLIMRIAEEYYPRVINNITISGVQQVLLHVKVMEVSRTKLRKLGFDFAQISSGNMNTLIRSGAAGLLGLEGHELMQSGDVNFQFGVVDGSSVFFGVLEALREDKLAKILAEPNIVAVSGRPAYFRVGGEFGYPLNGGITGPSVEFKQYGTRIDFVAIVLGNGRIRLEVRPQVTEIDASNSVQGVPALKVREAETGVEMQAGQTLAIAGLVQNRVEAQNKGLPWVSEVPYLGMLFRRVEEQNNEVELLIMVTPELVEAMDAHEVPPCGPGMRTTSPSDWELYFQGHLEVPNCCPPCPETGYQGGPLPEGPNSMGLPPGATIINQHEQIQTPHGMAPGGARTLPGRPGSTISPARSGLVNRPGMIYKQVAASGGKPALGHNRYTPSKRQISPGDSGYGRQNVEPGFIGPIGYDIVE